MVKRTLGFGFPILAFAGLLGMQAKAQDVRFSMSETESCIAGVYAEYDPLICIGNSAIRCIETSGGGQTTAVQVDCFGRELEAWDQRLNRAYIRLMAREKANDPVGSDTLRKMQRAWLGYVQARCNYASAPWVGGAGVGPDAQKCWMKMTGRQALFLEQKLQERELEYGKTE